MIVLVDGQCWGGGGGGLSESFISRLGGGDVCTGIRCLIGLDNYKESAWCDHLVLLFG